MIKRPIKLKDIVLEFSSRFEPLDDKLTLDIRHNKLTVPLIVEGPNENGKYYLIDGYRRFQSLKELGYIKVDCSIEPITDEVSRGIKRLRLQLRTRKKTRFELEREISYLLDRDLTVPQIAEAVGVYPSTIRRYIKSVAVPEEIKRIAESNKVGQDNLTKVYNMTHLPESLHSKLLQDCLTKDIREHEIKAIQKLFKISLFYDLPVTAMEQAIKRATENAVFSEYDASRVICLEAIQDDYLSKDKELTDCVFNLMMKDLTTYSSIITPSFVNQITLEQRQTALLIFKGLYERFSTIYWSFSEKSIYSSSSSYDY